MLCIIFVSLLVGVLGSVVPCGNVTVVIETYSGSPSLAGSVTWEVTISAAELWRYGLGVVESLMEQG